MKYKPPTWLMFNIKKHSSGTKYAFKIILIPLTLAYLGGYTGIHTYVHKYGVLHSNLTI